MATTQDTRNLKASRQAQTERFRQGSENEARAWSELPTVNPNQENKSHYRAQADTIGKSRFR